MSTHKLCFHGDIRKKSVLFGWKKKTTKKKHLIWNSEGDYDVFLVVFVNFLLFEIIIKT